MKVIPLTQGKFAVVDDSDFRHLKKFSWCVMRAKNTFYAKRRAGGKDGGKILLMHREIMKAPEHLDVDHRDGNGLDNRRLNLRLASVSQNLANLRKRSKASSRFKGVSWSKPHKKWRSYIVLNYKQKHLGLFTEEKLAARAYDEAAIRIYGEFARPNFI